MIDNKKVGLSLSGGGYRATAYHLGTFQKLNEMGVLDHVDIISTVSGGSIIGATYGLHSDNFDEFEKIIHKGVRSSVIWGVVTSGQFLFGVLLLLGLITAGIWSIFTDYAWLSLVFTAVFLLLIWFAQYELIPISKINERMYNKYFYHGKTLSELRDDVVLAINSTNLETGRPFAFSKYNMSDSTYSYPVDGNPKVLFDATNFPIARAVAASSSVPFAFTPIKIAKKFYSNPADYKKATPRLVDGGVYDNQGAHKLTQPNSSYNCDIVIISDAGNMMPFQNKYRNMITLLVRTSSVFMNRIKNIQIMKYLYAGDGTQKREIAYQALGWDVEKSVSDFAKSLKNGNILMHVCESHGITQADIDNWDQDHIESLLKTSIDYEAIKKQLLPPAKLKIARAVKTNLTALKTEQIDALIGHASVITEIQVKLYCPGLLKK